jgi:hypothetical protein
MKKSLTSLTLGFKSPWKSMGKGSSRPECLFLKPNPKPQFGFGGTCGASDRGVVMSIRFLPSFFSLGPVYKYVSLF